MSFSSKVARDFLGSGYSSESDAPRGGLASRDLSNLVQNQNVASTTRASAGSSLPVQPGAKGALRSSIQSAELRRTYGNPLLQMDAYSRHLHLVNDYLKYYGGKIEVCLSWDHFKYICIYFNNDSYDFLLYFYRLCNW